MENKKPFMIKKINAPHEIEDYELLLYTTFKISKYTNGWVLNNYIHTGPDHIRPCIGYEDQIIYGGYEGAELVGAMSININPYKYCQFHHIGFAEPAIIPPNSCEVLNFFTKRPLDVKIYQNFWTGTLVDDLMEKDIHRIFATCSGKIVRAYKRLFGFKELARREDQFCYLLVKMIE